MPQQEKKTCEIAESGFLKSVINADWFFLNNKCRLESGGGGALL